MLLVDSSRLKKRCGLCSTGCEVRTRSPSFAGEGGLGQGPHYVWSKELLEADNLRLAGDTACTVTTDEVMNLRCDCSRCWR